MYQDQFDDRYDEQDIYGEGFQSNGDQENQEGIDPYSYEYQQQLSDQDEDFYHSILDQPIMINRHNSQNYAYFHKTNNHQNNIDNNEDPQYSEQMRISGINYGVFDKQTYYKVSEEDRRGYQFPNGGTMRFRKRQQSASVLQITDNLYYKIQINVKQISQIINFPSLKMICICSSFPPQYYVSSQKQFNSHNRKQTRDLLQEYERFIIQKKMQRPRWNPFWKRILNIPVYGLQQTYPDELILAHLLVKNGAIFIDLFQYEKCIKNFKSQLFGHKQIKEIDLSKQLLNNIIQASFKDLLKKYSMKKFESYFDFIPQDDRGHIQKFDIMFSLISLLNISKHNVTIRDIFTLAQIISKIILKGKSIYLVWKALRKITSNHLQILKNTNRQQELEILLINFISKLQVSTKRQKFSDDDINQNAITVPLFKLTPSGLLPYGWSTDLRNRMVRHYKKMDHQFIKIEVLDDSGEKGSFGMFDNIFRGQIQRRLMGIQFFGRKYIPLGWTQSQLKNASMWFTLEKADCSFLTRSQLIHFLGDFSQIDNPALKAARMGQNLSTGFSINVKGVKVQLRDDDVSSKRMMYTDGIGMISADLVQKIQNKLQKDSTVFQVRFQGSKGLLSLNRQLQNNTIILRKSMKKFQCPNEEAKQYLDILDCNYYKTGYLNRQIILLLQSNNIPATNFIQIQRQYIQKIVNLQAIIHEEIQPSFQNGLIAGIVTNQISDKNQFCIQNIGQILGVIKRSRKMNVLRQPTLRCILCQKYQKIFDILVKKSKIRVQKSARILGIIDQYNVLQENEIYCTISQKDKSTNKENIQNISGKVMVTRNPCMHPADIRTARCVDKNQISKRFQIQYGLTNLFENLTNCVIFPKAGSVPMTSQISGSDLDGDEFFITWDSRLVPQTCQKPYIADDIKKQKRFWRGTDYPQIIDFFTEFISNDNLGRIGNSHLAKADKDGPKSPDCIKLCQAYNKAVDYPKKGYKFEFQKNFKPTKYPHFMQKHDKKKYTSKKALGRVYDNARSQYKRFVTKVQFKKVKVKFIPKFLLKQYSQSEIIFALSVINDFNAQIKQILKIYQFERESQIYALSKNKQNKQKLSFLANLQFKYFQKFFQNLPLQNNLTPQRYYSFMRETQGYQSLSNEWPLNKNIQDRILLWYHILHFHLLNKQVLENLRWIERIQQISISRNIDLNNLVATGLLWFCIPTLTFMVMKSNKCYQYDN